MSKRQRRKQPQRLYTQRFFKIRQFIGKHKKKLAIGIFLFIVLSLVYILRDMPSPTKLKSDQSFPVSTKIFDKHGELLYEIYAEENRTPIKLEDLPPYVSQASIAIEDQHFYSHIGFDVLGIIRAIKNTIFKQQVQGGSTITQQLVKTALLTRKKTFTRKAKEAVLTIATEIIYSKKDILEMYLNYIPYGGTAWGIEAASQRYFNKHAKDLTLSQAALLAGLPQSPTRYSPFGNNPELSIQRQQEVLRRMREDGYITKEEEEKAKQEKLVFAEQNNNIKAPHFVLYIKDQLVEKYGEAKVERGGLRVYTTLDWDLQNAAQASLSAEINKLTRYRVGNGAALVTKPSTGEILAMIGSKDYYDATADGQVNVTLRERQPGSSIKPLNVATALQLKKATPATMLLDIPTCFAVAGQQEYCPKNYDGSFHGPVQTRFFLGNSLNIPEVKLLAMNSLESFIATASAMGITTWNDPSKYGLSLTLGGGEVKMVDLVTAFGTFANEGVKVPLHSILKVEDYKGNILETYNPDETQQNVKYLTENTEEKEKGEVKRILDREPAYLVSHILLDNNARAGAFGTNSQLVIPNQTVSVKTGTTNELKDNWTIGFTPEYLTAVWVGNNDNTSMNQALVSGVTGAAPIWHDIMSYVLKGKKSVWPEVPKDIISKEVCTLTGLLPQQDGSCPTRTEFFWKGTEPQNSGDPLQKESWINPLTGIPPKEDEVVDGLVLQTYTFLSDPFTKDYCLDCIRPIDDKGKTMYENYVINMSTFGTKAE